MVSLIPGALMNRRKILIALGGTVAMWSTASRAQNAKLPVIGLLSATGLFDFQIKSLHSGLAEIGYTEGRNLTILSYSADGDFHKLPAWG